MRIVFIGSSEIAIQSFEKILNSLNHDIVGVISQPDKPAGRKKKLTSTALKSYALSKDLEVFSPKSISSDESYNFVKKLNFDIIVVVGYGQFIPNKIIELAKYKAINLHPSLLPKYRGASPIQYSLLNGDNLTGVSIIYVVDKMDAGDILLQKKVKIDGVDDFFTLHDKLASVGALALIEALNKIDNDQVNVTIQNNENVSFTKKIIKEDGLINWNDSAEEIYNKIRAFNYWPGGFSFLPSGEKITILKASINSLEGIPGTILDDKFTVAAGSKSISILELQQAGKKKMSVSSFLNGNKISKNQKMVVKAI